MSFLELVFSLPKNDRIVSFITISEHAKINIDEVELLVMRVMSLELVKGKIDQVLYFIISFKILDSFLYKFHNIYYF